MEVPVSIISDRDSRFTSHFLQSLQKDLGTRLDMSTTYHSQTDGESERTIQALEDMLPITIPALRLHRSRHFTVVSFDHLFAGPRLELPQQLSKFHSTFHVSNLKKCLPDKTLVSPLEEIQIKDKLHFIKELVEIMDREVKKLKQSRILIVKVRWNSRRGIEFTWEREDQF
ncbi:putative reverse transcriptase domain-containing protein [Tanacetum coccineum]